jgi:hypothetical protein
MPGYWLLDWIDEEGIADLGVIDGVLRTKSGYKRMLAAADEARRHQADPPREGKSLVTGAGLDLSGVLVGYREKRMKKRELAKSLARDEARLVVAGHTRSVWLCREVHGALGQSALRDGKLVTIQSSDRPSVSDVAMSLRLPVLDGASAE